jgi:hypothetical protein
VVKEGLLTESSGGHRHGARSKIDSRRPPPSAEKQHEKAHLSVAYLALLMMAFGSCPEEDFPTVDVAEVSAERLSYISHGLTINTERGPFYQLSVQACSPSVDIHTFETLYRIQNNAEGFCRF